MDLFALMIIGAGVLTGLMNGLGVFFRQPVPPNIFIIGLGLVVIGLVLLWNFSQGMMSG